MQELDFAVKIAKQAGSMIRRDFALGTTKKWKDDNSPVTPTDTAINKLVSQEVKKSFSKHGYYAEEGDGFSSRNGFTWVCDPLDGTHPFTLGIPTSVFALTLTKEGQPILGVMYDPHTNRLLRAEKGKGAYHNDKKIQVSQKTDLFRASLAFERTRNSFYTNTGQLIQTLSNKIVKLFVLKCICYGGILTALGEMVGLIAFGETAYDSAAVKIIVEEAGGKVTDIYGKEQRWDGEIKGVVASNGKLHKELLDIIKKAEKNGKGI